MGWAYHRNEFVAEEIYYYHRLQNPSVTMFEASDKLTPEEATDQ